MPDQTGRAGFVLAGTASSQGVISGCGEGREACWPPAQSLDNHNDIRKAKHGCRSYHTVLRGEYLPLLPTNMPINSEHRAHFCSANTLRLNK
eukprot:894819-Pelagomonas_calceolata.AAC.3